MSVSMSELDARLRAHQKALEAIVGVIIGIDPKLRDPLKAALRREANALEDGVAKDTIERFLVLPD